MNEHLINISVIQSIAQVDFSQVDEHALVVLDLMHTLIDPADDEHLIEPLFADIIAQLQERSVKVIILSHFNVADHQTMESCYEMLKKLEIDLSNSFSTNLLELPMFDTILSAKPVYYKGILFTNRYPKTEALSEFLHETHLVPSKIVFVDDHLEYVESLNRFAIKKEIAFQGYHYTGADKDRVIIIDSPQYF